MIYKKASPVHSSSDINVFRALWNWVYIHVELTERSNTIVSEAILLWYCIINQQINGSQYFGKQLTVTFYKILDMTEVKYSKNFEEHIEKALS